MNRSIRLVASFRNILAGRSWSRIVPLLLVALLIFPLQPSSAASRASLGAALAAQGTAPTVSDTGLTASGSWTLNSPVGWASRPTTISATVIDADGLQPATAAYRFSTNSGGGWSPWSSDAALQISSPVSTTVQMTVVLGALLDSATANLVEFRITDLIDTVETSPTYVIRVDGTAPGGPQSLVAEPATWTGVNAFALRWTNPAQSLAPINRAYYKLGSAPTRASDYGGYQESANVTQITGISVSTSGAIPCYVWLGDAAGNADYTTAVSTTLYYAGDGAPEPPIQLRLSPSSWTATNQFIATWTNPSTPSGIRAARYKWGNPPTSNADADGYVVGNNIQTLMGLTAPAEGNINLYVWLEDGAGRHDYTRRSMVAAYYDGTPPQTTYSFTPPLPVGGWYSDTVTVNLTAQDALSGVQVTRWRQGNQALWRDGTSISASTYITYGFKSFDNAGNEELERRVTVPIDKVPPTSAISLVPPVPPTGWFTSSVTANITAVDDLSGWSGDSYYRLDGGAWRRGTQVLISGNGSHDLEYYSRDRAGNTGAPQAAPQVCRIDTEAPTVRATASQTALYMRPPITITLEAEDAVSGVSVIEHRRQGDSAWKQGDAPIIIPVGAPNGVYTYEYRARDIAGNASAIQSITMNVDGTPPGQPTNMYAVPAGWTKTNGSFEVHWTNPTDLSAIAGAYYQLDTDPLVGGTPSGPFLENNIQALTGLTVTGEGSHDIYVWLVDGAGNADPATRQVLEDAFLYDSQAPASLTHQIDGPLGEDPEYDYYTGPITLTLNAIDAHSGIDKFYYQVLGEPAVTLPVTGAPLTATTSTHLFYESDRKQVQYWAVDVAGNQTAVSGPFTLRFDSLAPGSPVRLRVTPAQWSKTNSFTVSWTNPPVESAGSGVLAAYYKMGEPPTANDDGHLHILPPGQTSIPALTVDEQGQTPIYVWLKDRAGNVDYTTAISVVLRYDAVSPITTISVTGTKGKNEYYVSPVTLHLSAQDVTSSVLTTTYRVDLNGVQGTWQTWSGNDVILNQDGVYTVNFYSIDLAGNAEVTQSPTYKVDLHKPVTQIPSVPDYRNDSSVYVSWGASDGPHGSGVEKYTVQVRRGACGAWQNWRTNVNTTEAIYAGMQPNYFYYFRVRAEDLAGNVSDWAPLDGSRRNYVYREGLINPGFSTGSFEPWISAPDNVGKLKARVVYTTARTGAQGWVARLGEELGLRDDTVADGYASFYQQIQLPARASECGGNQGLALSFWVNMYSWDVAWSKTDQKWYDTLEVRIADPYGNSPVTVLKYGRYTQENLPAGGGPRWNSGWVALTADLTPWAGQTVRIEFRLDNRHDNTRPSWVYLDDVSLIPAPGRTAQAPVIFTAKGATPPRQVPFDQPALPARRDDAEGTPLVPAR